jgi:hypothetical protein
MVPSQQPSKQPMVSPSTQPFLNPSAQISLKPSTIPSYQPSKQPIVIRPSSRPSKQQLFTPSTQPYVIPSNLPSICPATHPSIQPSSKPLVIPSCHPSKSPLLEPTNQPFLSPLSFPSFQPFSLPTKQPGLVPSAQPSIIPIKNPSYQPYHLPTKQPHSKPSCQPKFHPTIQSTSKPTIQFVAHPSFQPNKTPSSQPTTFPNVLQPSSQPSTDPQLTPYPTNHPTIESSTFPTSGTQPNTYISTESPIFLPLESIIPSFSSTFLATRFYSSFIVINVSSPIIGNEYKTAIIKTVGILLNINSSYIMFTKGIISTSQNVVSFLLETVVILSSESCPFCENSDYFIANITKLISQAVYTGRATSIFRSELALIGIAYENLLPSIITFIANNNASFPSPQPSKLTNTDSLQVNASVSRANKDLLYGLLIGIIVLICSTGPVYFLFRRASNQSKKSKEQQMRAASTSSVNMKRSGSVRRLADGGANSPNPKSLSAHTGMVTAWSNSTSFSTNLKECASFYELHDETENGEVKLDQYLKQENNGNSKSFFGGPIVLNGQDIFI